MNIGVDLRCLLSPHRTGVGEYTVELLTALLKIDHENEYYFFYNSFSDQKFIPEFNFPNVHVLHTRFPNKLFSLSEKVFGFPKLDKIIANHFKLDKLDIFFSPHLNFTSLSKDTKHILTIHDLTFDLFPEFLTLKQKLWHKLLNAKAQCENATAIFAPSQNTKRDIISKYGIKESKIRVLYPGLSGVFQNPVLTSDVQAKYNLPNKFVLFLGTIEPRKNLDTLITAFQEFQKRSDERYDLVLAGAPGWKNKISKYLKDPSVHYIGYVDEKDKPALYREASLFIYPSFYEGFGFPVLEAMSAGLPVITSNRSSLPEITGDAAYLVNPHRPEEIVLGLKRILGSKTYALELSEKGQKNSQIFDWKIAAEEFLKVLNFIDQRTF